MINFKIYSFISIGLFLLMSAMFFTGNWAPVPGLGFIIGTMALLFILVARKVTKRWAGMSEEERGSIPVLKELRWYFVFGSIFFALDLFPHAILPIFYPNVQVITLFHLLAHIFLFISAILIARVAVVFFKPRWKTAVTVAVALIGFSAVVVQYLQPDVVFSIPTSKYPLVRSSALYGYLNLLSNLASFGFAGVFMLVMGFRSSEKLVRGRAVLMGLGMLNVPIIGFLIHFGNSVLSATLLAYFPLITYFFFIGWAGFLGVGALYTVEKEE